MSNSEQNEQDNSGLGNKQTKPESQYVECKFQAKNWVMTWNNYPDEQMSNVFDILKDKLVPLCDKYVFAKEIGEEGTPHIQGAFILKSKMRQGRIYNLLGYKFFLDKMKGKWEHQKYCVKPVSYTHLTLPTNREV